MLRRNFLKSLFCIPAVASVLPSLATPAPKKVIMSSMYGQMGYGRYRGYSDPFMILSPNEIVDAGFEYVDRPVFIADDQDYCIKTTKLTLWLPPERVEAFTSGSTLDGFKQQAIKEIKGMGLTHVYSVAFNPSPIYNLATCESLGHMAFVRGAKIFWYPGSIYQKAIHDARTA